MKKLQIGIMGSAADLNYSDEALNFSRKLGALIGESGNILVYGAEKEYTSLSTEAAKEDILTALRSGVNNYVVKPFTPETLQEKVFKLLDL